MKNNKLITKFMGYHTSDDQFKDENGFWNDTNVFETSWDWLMPVVEKIGDENLLSIDIDVVYDRIVEFIKGYNDEAK